MSESTLITQAYTRLQKRKSPKYTKRLSAAKVSIINQKIDILEAM